MAKFGENVPTVFDEKALSSEEESALVRSLSLFPVYLEKAEKEREPFVLAQYLVELARTFNKFYTHHRILDAKEPKKSSRLVLVKVSYDVLFSGLKLLGIPAPEKM